jgi:DNA-binding NarL/FixJ family response regulator
VAVIRVAIVDDQALVRAGFALILQGAPDVAVVGEAADGHAALRLVREVRPDVVLMDVRMPGLDGIDATRRIRESAPRDGPPRVLILTTYDLDEYVYAGLRAGAAGFVLKDVLAPDLIAAIRIVAAGEAVVAPTATRRLLERFVATPSPAGADDVAAKLTPRELEVMELVAAGLSNREIADRLVLSEGTVKTHVARILDKLDLRDRVQAVILAYETGLVAPGSDSAADR